jgi:hypothetical protein
VESRRELVDLIREQIEIEKESVVRLVETEKNVGTSTARLLLCEMRMDSQKHASVLEAVLEVLKEHPSSKTSWQQAFERFSDPIIVKREIEYHKALGKSMRTHLMKEMRSTNDAVMLSLFGHLAEDETRHDEILDTIAQRCHSMIR